MTYLLPVHMNALTAAQAQYSQDGNYFSLPKLPLTPDFYILVHDNIVFPTLRLEIAK